MLNNFSGEEFLRFSLMNYMDGAIDWANGTCYFDNEGFIALLDAVKRIEASVTGNEFEDLGITD